MIEQIRVTEVLDYFKEPWYLDWVLRVGKREANRIGKEAMKIGTRVDELIKNTILSDDWKKQTTTLKEKDEVMACLKAWDKWVQVYQPKSITPCTRLYATINGVEVTGEPDLMVDDVLVDIKCASKISPKYWLQVNTYTYLKGKQIAPTISAEMLEPHKVAILRLDKKTGSYEYVVKDYDSYLVEVWLGMLKAYLYLKESENAITE